MAWTVEYTPDAHAQLARLDPQVAERIVAFMDDRVVTSNDPRQLAERLHGPLRSYWRYRVGDWRIVCDIQASLLTVLVIGIGHRSQVYRR